MPLKLPHHPFSPATIVALDLAGRNAPPPTVVTALLRQADILQPIVEAALADARHVAFRDPPLVPRFMA